MLFMVNPPKKKRRSAAQKRATAKMIAANRRSRGLLKSIRTKSKKRRGTKKRQRSATTTTSRKRKPIMAAKRRKGTTKRRRRTTKRRSPVTSLRRHAVYQTNPRRRRRSKAVTHRRRRTRYHRNPALFATLQQGAMDAGATLVGGAAARIVGGLLPLPKDGLAGVASGLAVALGVSFAARKVVKGDTARFITAGAMQVPIKSLITTFVPQAGAYLGDYDSIGAYALPSSQGVGDYLQSGGMAGMYGSPAGEIGVYE